MENARALEKADTVEALSAVVSSFGDEDASRKAINKIIDDLYREH